ncbi:MAG: RNA 2',3'-cyclic phosphodiesterase [Candidatus Cloacimonetes bacterium]|nr:RNA 2',3'-cyclic phosphodiesterase [Candidatus Cloacimonadota bacterium]
MIRTFLALNLPIDVRKQISNWQGYFRDYNVDGLKWVATENLHVTLQFAGDIRESDLPDLIDFLGNEIEGKSSVQLTDAKIDIIPGKLPRIIWIKYRNQQTDMAKLVKKFRNKLNESGYTTDNKPLSYHVTLARIKKRLPEYFVQKILTTELKMSDFVAEDITLYRSILRPEGPVYEALAEYKLKKE